MEKYLKMNQRVSQRFQEFQMTANENAMAAAKRQDQAINQYQAINCK